MAKIFNRNDEETDIVVRDKDGVEVNPDDMVEVKHCTGKYGQTETVVGKFIRADFFGVYLKFNTPYHTFGRHGSYTYEAGKEVMFAISQDKGVFYHKHHDYEHGHDTHMKKVVV